MRMAAAILLLLCATALYTFFTKSRSFPPLCANCADAGKIAAAVTALQRVFPWSEVRGEWLA